MTKLHGQDKAAEEVAKIFEVTDNDVSSLITYRELKSMLASASQRELVSLDDNENKP